MCLKANNQDFREEVRLEDALPDLDLLYMTRVQKERFFNEEDYVRMKDFYILDKAKLALAKDDMLVLHPLPRVNEIATEVDDDPRAVYFKQATVRRLCAYGTDSYITGGRGMLNVGRIK